MAAPLPFLKAMNRYVAACDEAILECGSGATTMVINHACSIDGNREALLVGKQKNAFQCFVKAKAKDTVYLIENHLLELKKEGCCNLIVVPISFSMDHLETLYDLDQELKDFCDDKSLNLCRSQPANANDDFITMLAQFIKKTQKTTKTI